MGMKFRRADGSVLGEIDTEKDIFTIIVNDTKIRVKEPGGWAIEVGVIDMLSMLVCKELQIMEDKTLFSTPFENFTNNGVLIESDYGDKILVADEYWEEKPSE